MASTSEKTDWEKELCQLVDDAKMTKEELAYFDRVEKIINFVEDLIELSYLRGKGVKNAKVVKIPRRL